MVDNCSQFRDGIFSDTNCSNSRYDLYIEKSKTSTQMKNISSIRIANGKKYWGYERVSASYKIDS